MTESVCIYVCMYVCTYVCMRRASWTRWRSPKVTGSVCMCVGMYVYVCEIIDGGHDKHMGVCMYVCVYAGSQCMYIYIYVCMQDHNRERDEHNPWVYVCMYVCMLGLSVRIYVYVCVYARSRQRA